MAERPMIFSAPMVRALLDGTKTQTRRLVKRERDPECVVGDTIWVRETWASVSANGMCHAADDYYVYRATDPDWETMDGWKWQPAIFMPRRASRMTLKVASVRLQSLHDIDDADARSEGVGFDNECRSAFIHLWETIYGPGSWADNPMVWAITFRRV